jgi:hypothetical protein
MVICFQVKEYMDRAAELKQVLRPKLDTGGTVNGIKRTVSSDPMDELSK